MPLQMCARYFYLARCVFFKKFLIIPENYAVIYRIKASNNLFKVMKLSIFLQFTKVAKTN